MKKKVLCFKCEGYGHISSECANTLKKQKDGKNKALHTTWSDSDSDSENNEKAIALITIFIMKKYDDLLAASQKLSKRNSELVKDIAVLKLENNSIANEFQSSDTDYEKVSTALELELKISKEMIISLNFGAQKIDKMISMGRRDGDKRGLEFELSNKSSAESKIKFVKSSSPIEPSATHEVKKFIPICHFCGTRGHI
ncbi:hypothetical protein L3X38_025580 [Prunus dulcis]|uniref:CCHC-type domain-containing protein n=1 Tax=Prunus dulcis TaxID=3755 RepID=A0AAD4W4N7_PRUDU|nr:hypothetical protein L3X38_025580 [Prunus dulcis]